MSAATKTADRDPVEIEMEIQALSARIEPMLRHRRQLEMEKARVESRRFIADNQITRDQVDMDAENLFWIGDYREYGAWLRATKSTKPWALWNGRIYRTTDVIHGKMPDTPGMVEDLEPKEAK